MDPDDFFGLNLSNLTDIVEDDESSKNSPQSSFSSSDDDESSKNNSKPSFSSSDDVIIIGEQKRKTDLQKVCGFQSYQHVIEKAIYCSSEKHLTLNQIYDWIEENVPYFRNMSKANNSKSWKNSIRHNLSLHKQFYKVLREGNRSCLWGCDRNRIIKNNDKMIKQKKIQKQQQPMATFRPRASTEPTMVKPMILPKTTQVLEAEFITKPIYKNLSARFEALEAKQETLNQGKLSQPNENITSFFVNTNGSNFKENQILPPQFVTQNMTVSFGNRGVEQNILRNERYVNTKNKFAEVNQTEFTSPFSNFSSSLTNDTEEFFPLLMNLDEQAIIDHERHLYEMNY
jgi:hypothetical protein